MKSNKYIENTELATLKNNAKAVAQITIPASTTVPNGTTVQTLASTTFVVGTSESEPQFIYEDEDGRIYTNYHEQLKGTLRQYSTIDSQWHNTQWYARIQVVRTAPRRYRLEAFVTVHWGYSANNATFTITSQKIKVYVHTFLNPFNQ